MGCLLSLKSGCLPTEVRLGLPPDRHMALASDWPAAARWTRTYFPRKLDWRGRETTAAQRLGCGRQSSQGCPFEESTRWSAGYTTTRDIRRELPTHPFISSYLPTLPIYPSTLPIYPATRSKVASQAKAAAAALVHPIEPSSQQPFFFFFFFVTMQSWISCALPPKMTFLSSWISSCPPAHVAKKPRVACACTFPLPHKSLTAHTPRRVHRENICKQPTRSNAD